MTQYGFYFDSTRCTGCCTCTLACKDYKDLDQVTAFRKVYDFEGGETSANAGLASSCFIYHVSRSCQHCENPACVANCPQASMQKDPETGLVFNDPETCIGCGMCVNSCPYGAPTVDMELAKSIKCNGCYERIIAGLNPICADACPLRAIEFGDIEDLKAAHPGCDADIAPLADPSITGPSLIVNKCASAKPASFTDGIIGNATTIDGVPAREMFNEYTIS